MDNNLPSVCNNNRLDRNNGLLLPSILGSSKGEDIDRALEKQLAPKNFLMDIAGMYNTGEGTVALISDADGYGKPDKAMGDRLTSQAYTLVGNLLRDGRISVLSTLRIIPGARVDDLASSIKDTKIANILLFGHADYHSWVATDRVVDWYMAGRMADKHLKNGVFGNLGCGAIRSWAKIPLGRYVVGSKGVLLGKYAEYARADDMASLDRYQVLK